MATMVARPAMRRTDDVFFPAISVVMLLIVLIGFAPTYFLKGAVFAPLPSLLLHLHGAVFSLWIILFVVQSSLVASGNIKLHRKLGILGCVIAGLMVILGVLTTFGALRRGALIPGIFTPAVFLISNSLAIIIFGALVAAAIGQRNNGKVHKRLMVIANFMLMPPAITRIPFVRHHGYLIGLIPLSLIVALVLYDMFTWRRPLKVTVIGGLVFVLSTPVMLVIAHTPFAARLTTWAQHHP